MLQPLARNAISRLLFRMPSQNATPAIRTMMSTKPHWGLIASNVITRTTGEYGCLSMISKQISSWTVGTRIWAVESATTNRLKRKSINHQIAIPVMNTTIRTVDALGVCANDAITQKVLMTSNYANQDYKDASNPRKDKHADNPGSFSHIVTNR